MGGGADQPAADADDPLSETTLLEAIKGTGSKATLWSVDATQIGTTQGSDATELNRNLLSGESLKLHLKRTSDALYWGQWERYTEATDKTKAGYRHGSIWGGTTHYGKKPESSIDTATYSAKGVLRSSTDGGKTWKHDKATADLTLEANFGRGKVGGSIEGTVLDGLAPISGNAPQPGNNDILLMETDIGSEGMFSGSAKFSASGITRQDGEWDGGFFGPTTGLGTGDDSEKQVHKAPSHVAGEFSVERKKITIMQGDVSVTTQNGLFIEGAFGSQ